MSNKYEAKAIYDEMIHDVTTSEKKWQDVCRLTGQIYRFEFDNILMVYGQRPHSTMIADYDTWKKVERYVKRGSKGIAIFPSRALNPRMRYVFDISDTGGKKQKLTWDLEGENLKDYLDYLVSEGQMEQYEGTTREELLNSLKLFTGTNVWGIIRTDFEERISELSQLAGSMIKELNYETSGLTTDDLVYQSVMYAVGTRCGFDLSMQEQDFSQIVKITDEEVIYRLGSLVCDVSCSVLREFSRNLKTIESERRIAYGRINNDVSRSGRTTVSGYSDAGRAGSEINESREIRNTGDELSNGERTSKVQDTLPIRETGRENERGERGSLSTVRPADERLPEETQTRESEFHDGDVETERTGEDAGRGSSPSADRNEISLGADEELNRELNEINSFGNSKEANYHQASFFDGDFGLNTSGLMHVQTTKISAAGQKYTYIQPKKELVVPHEFVRQTLLRGTGFVNGMSRVCKIYQNEIDAGTRARRIKKEYGQGGAGWPIEGYGLHGYDSFHAQGLRFQWRDEEGEKEGYISWGIVEKEIGVLIMTGEYQPERQSLDEIAMDGDREDYIDTDHRVIYDTDEQKVTEAVDAFAIPDEPESYESHRHITEQKAETETYEMTPEELSEEDRMVTMAEYGAELEAENRE